MTETTTGAGPDRGVPANRFSDAVGRLRRGGIAGDTAWGLVLELSTLVSTMIAFVLLGNQLGTEAYGDYIGLYSVIGPLGTLAVSGVALSMMQHVIRDNEDLDATLRSCLSITFVLGGLLTTIGLLVVSQIIPTLPLATAAAIVMMEFISQPTTQLAATAVQIHDGFAAAARLRLVPIGLRVAIFVTLKSIGHLNLATLGATHLVTSTILAVILLRHVGRRVDADTRPGHIDLRHLKTSGVYSVGIFGLSLQNDGDKSVLAANGFRGELGLYGAAYRIVQFGLLPVGTLVGVSHQRFLKHTEGVRSQHLRRSVQFAAVTAAYGTAFAIVLWFCAPLLKVFFKGFGESVQIVRWLTPLVVLRGLSIFPLNGLMGLGRTKARTVLLLVSAGFSMILYITVIPSMGWKGAVLSTIIGEAALAIAAWIMLLVFQRGDNESIRQAELAELLRRAHSSDLRPIIDP